METIKTVSTKDGVVTRPVPTTDAGLLIARFGVALVLGWIGLFKFTPTEANAIVPLIEHSPLMSWLLPTLGIRGTSNLIGSVEIITAVLLVAGTWSARALLAGSVLGTLTFAATLSFLFTTPGMFSLHDGFWVADGFLLKDVTLLGVCLSGVFSALHRLKMEKRPGH